MVAFLDDQLFTATHYEVDLWLEGEWYQVMQEDRKDVHKYAFHYI